MKRFPKVGDGLKVRDAFTLPCSGCSGSATFTPHGEHPTFVHTMPFCERFDRVKTIAELAEYMHECKRKQDTQVSDDDEVRITDKGVAALECYLRQRFWRRVALAAAVVIFAALVVWYSMAAG